MEIVYFFLYELSRIIYMSDIKLKKKNIDILTEFVCFTSLLIIYQKMKSHLRIILRYFYSHYYNFTNIIQYRFSCHHNIKLILEYVVASIVIPLSSDNLMFCCKQCRKLSLPIHKVSKIDELVMDTDQWTEVRKPITHLSASDAEMLRDVWRFFFLSCTT